MINILCASLEQSLMFFPLIIGIYISYQILNITDLSIDGSYVLGGAIFARTIDHGLIIALSLSIICGVIVGNIVSYMQRRNIVSDLVVGVLASFMLYSVNLEILGKPNVSVLNKTNILSFLHLTQWYVPLVVIAIIITITLTIILKSQFGLTLRAFGHNQQLLSILGKNPENYRAFGLAFSASLAALSGAMATQINGFADINMGFGVTRNPYKYWFSSDRTPYHH